MRYWSVALSLPIVEVLTTLTDGLLHHNQLLLLAPPGAGKSTWLPLQLLKLPWITGKIRLVTQRISRASMTQRAGRAGRIMPGVCWHLLTKEQAERSVAQREPEITYSDLSGCYFNLLL